MGKRLLGLMLMQEFLKIPYSGPILEFKGSVRYVKKEHPTLVT